MSTDYEHVLNQFYVTQSESKPKALGVGPKEIRGAAYFQAPFQVGKDSAYEKVEASLMVGQETNPDTPTNAERSLFVKGDSKFIGDGQTENSVYITTNTENSTKGERSLLVEGDSKFVGDGRTENAVRIENPTNESYPLYVDGNAYFNHPNIGDLSQRFNTADARPKPFDMTHPSLGEGHRLRYACIEGPEVGVYFRGRVKNTTEIDLPWYWKDLIHIDSISVQLQPIGAHQDIIIKRWDSEKIYLQSNAGIPIDCFYHVYAERKDVNSLIVEYDGNTWSDYPDKDYNDPQYENKINTKTL